jgi:hypothetical protein
MRKASQIIDSLLMPFRALLQPFRTGAVIGTPQAAPQLSVATDNGPIVHRNNRAAEKRSFSDKKREAGSSKGFFFTLIIFLIVSYILLSTSLWIKSTQESERRFADQFRTSNIESIVSQVDKGEIKELSDGVVKSSLYKLNERTQSDRLKAGGSDGLLYLSTAMRQLVTNGTAGAENFNSNTPLTIGRGLEGWRDELNNSLSKIGLEVSNFKVKDFKINQSSVDSADYVLNLSVTVRDKVGTTSIERNYTVSGRVNITGFVDPAVAKTIDTKSSGALNVQKQYFFHSNYPSPSSITLPSAGSGSAGQGWFYGPLVKVSNAKNISKDVRNQYILVGTYSQVISLRGNPDVSDGDFGAVILTSAPTLLSPSTGCPAPEDNTYNPLKYDSKCAVSIGGAVETRPFAVSPGFNPDTAPVCPQGRCVLFVAKYSYADVVATPTRKLNSVAFYNMESLRDFTVCGYYTNNVNAPSFLQRMLDAPYSRSDKYGIETFLVGSYIGGKNVSGLTISAKPLKNELSRVDSDVYNDVTGTKIRGMPGCKNALQCGADSPVGQFALSDLSATRYSSTALKCSSGPKCE